MPDYWREAQDLFAYSQGLRRDFHRHPELGFHEFRSAGVIAEELQKLGLEVTTGVGETGVVAVMEGDKPGPTLLARFDMDALPIREETGSEYASIHDGVMHACGHDGHMAVGLTVAQMLNRHRDQMHGRVKLVFQPAEEGLGGAEGMIAAGVLESPAPDRTLALHIWNEIPLGTIVMTPGPFMAGAERFIVKLSGRGAHAAMPDLSIDPVVAAAQIITALQTIVSRNIAPLQAAVISVAQVQAGDAFNVIPQTATLQGTIRALEPAVRQKMLERFYQVVLGISQAMGCQAEIDFFPPTPAVINDIPFTWQMAERMKGSLPQARVDTSFRLMVSEDMASMMERIPGCYFMVGGATKDAQSGFPHHHPKFDFDEQALIWASAAMVAAITGYLNKP